MRKILVAIQFWEGDKPQAMKLARYLADLEPKHCALADILLVNRFDCPQDPDTLAYVARKFNVYKHRSTRRGVGWPHGCNSLFFGTLEWVFSMIEARKVPDYKAIFTCEGDGAPISKNWVEKMSQAWDAACKPRPVVMAGPMVGGADYGMRQHINGNAMVSGEIPFLRWLTRSVSDVHPSVGWDYILADSFKQRGWANIPEMRSIYNTPHFTEAEYQDMLGQGLIWVHGDKSNCLIDYGRKYHLGQK